MDQGFLGNGWNYALSHLGTGIGVDTDGQIAEASGEESVRQSIWLILSTAKGERVGRPEFGCDIHELVFAPNTPGTQGDAIRAVREALVTWEPRIDVLAVDARPDTSEPSVLIIEIHYRIRATNSRFNLVYPFYLST